MKLLFDQNLSPFLCGRVADLFPDSIHVREIGLSNADDAVIWHYAADHGFVVVSKDADFRQRSFLYGHPPMDIHRKSFGLESGIALPPRSQTYCAVMLRKSGSLF